MARRVGKGFLVGLVSLLFRFFFAGLAVGFACFVIAIEAFLKGIVWVGFPPPLPSNSGKNDKLSTKKKDLNILIVTLWHPGKG